MQRKNMVLQFIFVTYFGDNPVRAFQHHKCLQNEK